jgi:hypothetical protein
MGGPKCPPQAVRFAINHSVPMLNTTKPTYHQL